MDYYELLSEVTGLEADYLKLTDEVKLISPSEAISAIRYAVKNLNIAAVSVSLPPDFKCCMVNEEIGCAFNGKKCHICTKAVESELSNYYAPFRRK